MRLRLWIVPVVLVVLVFAGLVAAALVAWPRPSLAPDGDALARIGLPGFAGRVAAVRLLANDGTRVPVELRRGELWPLRKLDGGERLTVEVTVRRPGWAAWLVGREEQRVFRLDAPVSHLTGRWLQVKTGAPVRVAFDRPVRRVSVGSAGPRQLARPRKVVPVGLVAGGSHRAGTVLVAAAARSWERLPPPVRVSWFPPRPHPQLLAQPRPGAALSPRRQLTLTFSRPVRDVLGSRRPKLSPATPGHWRLLDAHTLAFRPNGFGFGFGADVRVDLPRAVRVVGKKGSRLTRKLQWQVPDGSTLRLQQLLSELGYLPVAWHPAADPARPSIRGQLAAALSPPAGWFSWRYAHTPSSLKALWKPGQFGQVTRGAVMAFQSTHDLAVDAIPGPRVWKRLIADAIAGKKAGHGYSYVLVRRRVPQHLLLWHNGRTILTVLANTGVPAAPTALGTSPVFERQAVGTMSGQNPDGSHYVDPGIQWISYFNGGEAIHGFNRGSYGYPQSVGCVELSVGDAARVWPYTPIGTLVTIVE